MELNRQDLNTPDNKHIITHTPGTELTNNDMKRGQETNHIKETRHTRQRSDNYIIRYFSSYFLGVSYRYWSMDTCKPGFIILTAN